MNDDDVPFYIAITCAAIFGVLGIILFSSNGNLKTQAIERGYALHCPIDGKFAWAGECEE